MFLMVAVAWGVKCTFGILFKNGRMVEMIVLHFLSCLGCLWLRTVSAAVERRGEGPDAQKILAY